MWETLIKIKNSIKQIVIISFWLILLIERRMTEVKIKASILLAGT